MYVTECVARVCTRKLERVYLCMHVCSSVCMPLLRVCACVFLCKSVSKQGIPTDTLSSFTTWKTKVKITRMNCWYRMTNLWIYEYKYKYIYNFYVQMSVSLNATHVCREKMIMWCTTGLLFTWPKRGSCWSGPPPPQPQPQPQPNRGKREIPPEDAQALVRVVCYCVSMLLRWPCWERTVLEHKEK